MKEIYVKIDCDDTFVPGCCTSCPVAKRDADKDYILVCPFSGKFDHCPMFQFKSSNVRKMLYQDDEICVERRVDGRFFITLFNKDGSFSREVEIKNTNGKVTSCVH